jgi:hypothetical protein
MEEMVMDTQAHGKDNRFTQFIRKHVFKKTEIARNPIWISLKQQANNFAWDGSSTSTVLDSIFFFFFRTIVLFVTGLFLPLGFLALMEQVFRSIITELWDNMEKKYGFNFLSSAVALVVAGIFWLASALFCMPTMIFIPISYFIAWLEDHGWPLWKK